MQLWRIFTVIICTIGIVSCTGIPAGVTPINYFNPPAYMGKWYEIARLDHSFERGMDQVTAHYQPNQDNSIQVKNRGYKVSEQRWQEAIGKAKSAAAPNIGYLKVSFYGPFYGSYIVIDADREFKEYSLVSGPNRKYLWILSRTPQLEPATLNRLLKEAAQLGYPTQQLIFVKQTP